jgi:hypothetical protein
MSEVSEVNMNSDKASGALLFYYAYALTLGAFLLMHDAPVDKVSALALLAWLLINRRPK